MEPLGYKHDNVEPVIAGGTYSCKDTVLYDLVM
jgi:hypothetical protein